MYIDEDTKQQILARATLEDALDKFCTRATGYRDRHRVYTCPFCGKEMEYHPGKQLVKCFHCDWGTNSAVTLLMDTEKIDYPAALQRLADAFGVVIPERPRPEPKPRRRAEGKTFCVRQLEESGLTVKDVRATWRADDNTVTTHSPFTSGTVTRYGTIADTGDDMIIHYLDLDGRPVTFTDTRKGQNNTERPYFRVRWQYPESHTLPDGSTCKYKSPAGSGVQLYIPETLRQAYRQARHLDNLYFTEGEKKAEAVSKYVGPAFGMAGINCLAGRDHQLPESIVRVIEQCGVQRIYFIMDSDYNDLSRTLTPDRDATQRPRAFFAAARNFRDWFLTLRNRNIDVEVYLVLGNGSAKGVDDQLVLMNDKNRYRQLIDSGTADTITGGHTEYFDVVKISTITDANLQGIWGLNNVDEFLSKHMEQLKGLDTFRAFRNLWRINENGEKELAQKLRDDEIFWIEQTRTARDGTQYTDYRFDYVNMVHLLENRGYHRYVEPSGEHSLVHLTGQRIERVQPIDMRDEVMDLARQICNKDVMNMIYRNHANYLGPSNMSLVSRHYPEMPAPDRESQILLFRTKYWTITADGIKERDLSSIPYNYWQQDLKPFDAHRCSQRMVNVVHTDEGFQVAPSVEGAQCDFLKYLMLTSWFDWDRYMDEDRVLKPQYASRQLTGEDCGQHLLSKMTAIGYLLHHYHNPAVAKAVIALDERISAVGESQGRSGKSLISVALEQMTNVVTIPARGLDLAGDRFALEQVTPNTRVITLDDIDINFDFELLFPAITSSVVVNGKGTKRFSLTGHDKPKFYITTNHTINANTGSAKDRMFKLAFSNYFDDTYKPEREFGGQFFGEYWEQEQWNLFYNLMAECLLLYFEAQRNGWGVNGSGLIEAPCDNIERRQMRQQMTEGFYRWIMEYLNIDEDSPSEPAGTRLGEPIERAMMFDSYKTSVNRRELGYITPQKFWQRLNLFCRYWGYTLNPHIPRDAHNRPGHDKSNGIERVTISEKPFESSPA